MTTGQLSERSGEGRFAVAVETVALTVAAIGLCLGLLATDGQQSHGAGVDDSGLGGRL